MSVKTFGAMLLGTLFGLVLAGGIMTYKTHETMSTAGRSFGIVAKGFVPAKPVEWPEANSKAKSDREYDEAPGDIASEEQATFTTRFAALELK